MNVEKLREAARVLNDDVRVCLGNGGLSPTEENLVDALCDFSTALLAATEPAAEPVRVVEVTGQHILNALARDGAFNVTVHDVHGEERVNATVEHFAAVLAARINGAAGEG